MGIALPECPVATALEPTGDVESEQKDPGSTWDTVINGVLTRLDA